MPSRGKGMKLLLSSSSLLVFRFIALLVTTRQQQQNMFVMSSRDNDDIFCGSQHNLKHGDNYNFTRDEQIEAAMFGKAVKGMKREDLSSIIRDLLSKREEVYDEAGKGFHRNKSLSLNILPNELVLKYSYQLVDIPIVYHVLTKQNSGGIGRPSLTDLQRDYTTKQTNKAFNIYDKDTKQSIQFVSFVTNGTIMHDDVYSIRDCENIDTNKIRNVVMKAVEWEYKVHVVICKPYDWFGLASFPSDYYVDDPLHNSIFIDYRAFACYDDFGKFLCNDPTTKSGEQSVSHSSWKTSKSLTVAHELGHLFGLRHVFGNTCLFDSDGVPDTAIQKMSKHGKMFGNMSSCPGLLPYDKDRDLFDYQKQQLPNTAVDTSVCTTAHGTSGLCPGDTCAACCLYTRDKGKNRCQAEHSKFRIITEDENNFPICCPDSTPLNSCPRHPGIDNQNNIMSYAPDYCKYEMTAGQMARMMVQTRQYKDYIYCNYATTLDTEKCTGIPCASTATSPNCQ